jgi:hypothetical protein
LNHFSKKTAKIFRWALATIITLFLLLLILIHIPAVQNFTKEKLVTYIETKIKTKVVIESLEFGILKKISLKGIYIEDQKKDTLLAGKNLTIDISLLQLLNNKIEIKSIALDGITSYLNRNSQGNFNFDYILKAFISAKKTDDKSTPMAFSINQVELNKIKLNYKDNYAKNELSINLKHFDTHIKTFDLNLMNFEIPKFKISGLQIKLKEKLLVQVQKTNPNYHSSSTINPFKLKLGEIDFKKIAIDYENENSKITSTATLRKLAAKFEVLDLTNRLIVIKSIGAEGIKGILSFGKLKETISKSSNRVPSSLNNWEVKINEADLNKVNFKFDDNNFVAQKKGIDYKHLNLTNLNLKTKNTHYSPESIAIDVNSFSVREQSGLEIQSFSTALFIGKKNTSLENLYLKTPQSLLNAKLVLGYPSIEIISKNLGELSLKANLKSSKLGFKDILFFAPTLRDNPPFKNNPNAILVINSTISGKLKNIEIPNLNISGIGKTQIQANGKIIGLPNTEKAFFDLILKNFESTSSDVNQFVSKGTIPNSIMIPSHFSAKGTFKGTLNNFNTTINLVSNSGNAKIKATYDQRIKNQEAYEIQTELSHFDLGKFTKNDALGKTGIKANLKGVGLNLKTARFIANATILSATYNKYTYRNLKLNTELNNGNYTTNIQSKDPNITFDAVSSGGFKDKHPTGKLKLNIDIADLEKLNLHAGPLKLRANIDADIQSIDFDYLNGKVLIHNLEVNNEKGDLKIDTIQVIASNTAERNQLQLHSLFLDAKIDGKYKLSQIKPALTNSISTYYNTSLISKKTNTNQHHFDFDFNIKNRSILTQLIPDLKSIEPFRITGKYNSINDTIAINGIIPKIIYGENTISNILFKAETKSNSLVYSLIIDNIEDPKFLLPFTSIYGKVENNILDYNLQIKDLQDKERFFIAGKLIALKEDSQIRLNSDKLMLNYQSWNLTPDNLIRFGKNGIYTSNFELNKEETGTNKNSIKIQSQSEKPNAPIAIDFKNFEIATITGLIEKKDLLVNGLINGNALLKGESKKHFFTSDLVIENFVFKKDTLGTISIKINNEIPDQYDTHLSLTGQENLVNIDGVYKANDSSFDINMLIDRLNIKSIQGFSMNQLTESTGFLNGSFNLSGNTNAPQLIGGLQFNDIAFKVVKLNAKFKSMNDAITIKNKTISFDHFTIKDDKNNDLIINGKIDNTNFSNLGFDLSVDADNFKLINSKSKDNELFYGELFIDNHLKVTGTLDHPKVEGNIKINKETKFNFVMPQSDPSLIDREGIIEFIDQDQPEVITTLDVQKKINQSNIKGIDASVNIEIDKEAEFTIVIDKSNGDYLKLKGDAHLNGGIDPSGKNTLTGKYSFSEGTYEMTFNSLKRKFDIKKGSYILWNGEPTTADVNITAIYKLKTAPLDLLQNELKSKTEEQKNTYKEKIEFETQLKMNGEILKPEITFDIILPETNTVSSEIVNATKTKLDQIRQDPNELNKQVFSLLLLSHFMGENPFSTESGSGTVSSLAKASASKILSEQLNNLAGDLIKGVEIDFNLESTEDYTSGNKEDKTDLSIAFSKKLLNDRLKVSIGSSFDLDGAQQVNQSANNIADDVSLDYKLSKDGKYKIRGYRINKYQVALQGEVVETGLAFIITLDYNKFKELFKKSNVKVKNKTKKSDD